MSKWAAGVTRNKDGTINRRLADFLELRVAASAKPVDGVYSKDVTLDAEAKTWARLFIPVSADEDAARTFPVVFYFHGGGFSLLSPDFILYDRFCKALARHSQVRTLALSSPAFQLAIHRVPEVLLDVHTANFWWRNPEYGLEL